MGDIDFNRISLLCGLDRISLARLIPGFERVEINSGELVFKQGQPGDSLYIIIDGIVRVYLEPGGLSREIACLHVLIVMLAVALSLFHWRYLGLIP